MNAPQGRRQPGVATATIALVALAHALGLQALLGATWAPSPSSPAEPRVAMVRLLGAEPEAAESPVSPPPAPRPPPRREAPPPPRAAAPVPAPPAAPAAVEPLRPPPLDAAPAAAAVARPAAGDGAAPSSAVSSPSGTGEVEVAAGPAAGAAVTRQIQPADYLRAPVLEYPSASRRYGEQGRVVLRVLIGREGQAEKIELHEASAFPRLNEAAIEAARRALYKPYTEDGVAQPAWVLVALSFQLRR